jgi:hypothetical protein
MRFKQVGNKEDLGFVVIRNSDTVKISKGDPVILNLNGTNDGLDIIRANSSAAKTHALLFGVATKDVEINEYGEAQVFGFCRSLTLVRATRAASTDSWASQASIGAYNWLTLETVYGGFSSLASSAATYSPFAVLGESLASYASSASVTSDTRTAITTSVKGFLRIL